MVWRTVPTIPEEDNEYKPEYVLLLGYWCMLVVILVGQYRQLYTHEVNFSLDDLFVQIMKR